MSFALFFVVNSKTNEERPFPVGLDPIIAVAYCAAEEQGRIEDYLEIYGESRENEQELFERLSAEFQITEKQLTLRSGNWAVVKQAQGLAA